MDWQTVFRNDSLRAVLRTLISYGLFRQGTIRFIERKAQEALLYEDAYGRPLQVQEDKKALLSAVLHSIDRGIERGLISKRVLDRALRIFLLDVLCSRDIRLRAQERLGFMPPLFVTISPTMKCNLRCPGCYATSAPHCEAKLDWDTFDRILTEMKELWGSCFAVISGGEPFLWNDNGRTFLDMAEKHDYRFFLVYTNGTLIDDKLARRLAELGNITPAISVEGYEAETDAIRGKGVYKRILRAFDALREAGVMFGISITATRRNWDLVTREELFDFYFEEQGALYAWIFQYMPIGRKHAFDLMVTPQQRLEMLRRVWRLVRERKMFIADFWNSGTASDGCIAAGRAGGYFYINWNGDVTPCVFIPYAAANIYDIYRSGGTLNDVLQTPLFKRIRDWQHEYGYQQPAEKTRNWLCPCAIRDHFDNFLKAAQECPVTPIDPDAEQALGDPEYHRAMIQYGKEFDRISSEIWEREYIAPHKGGDQQRVAV